MTTDFKEHNFQQSFDKNNVPLILDWTVEKVGNWIALRLQLPQYKECFTANHISGQQLILLDASNLPKIGITDFSDILFICLKVRQLLGIEEPNCNRSLTLPPRDAVSHFLERKSITGTESNSLTFEEHARYLKKFREHKDCD